MGASRTVTGSCYILEAAGRRFAIDCGMHQGNTEIEKRNWDIDVYDPKKIDFFVITHAHIDHSGLLPRMVQKGFRGAIYTTPPTQELLKIMLLDSAHIQEMEATWKSKRRLRYGEGKIVPLYTKKDAEDTFPFLQAVPYASPFQPFPDLTVIFHDAGHILGASIVEVRIKEGKKESKLVFSGDLGRPSQFLVRDPTIISEADFLFLESTYGNRDHKDEETSLDELAEAIAYSYKRHQKVIIPAFAVERTQELLYSFRILSKDGRLPPDMPVYVDSPLAIRATEIFRRCSDYLDAESQALLKSGEDPLNFPQLRYALTTQESMEINSLTGPLVVISASGMANAGRIKHHLRHNLWQQGASVVFVGFQAQGTPGRKIIDGANQIRLFAEEIAVRAKIFTINGFSAHAGQSQLLAWLSHFTNKNLQLFLMHGEYTTQQIFAEEIRKRFDVELYIPDYLEEMALIPGERAETTEFPEKAAPRINWSYILNNMESEFALLKGQMEQIESRGWLDQTEIRDRILDITKDMQKIISEI